MFPRISMIFIVLYLFPSIALICVYFPVFVACDEWKVLQKPNLHRDVNRFGHAAVVSNGSMYIFGGFSSVLLNDILVYKPPSCEAFLSEELCTNAVQGISCLWDDKHCISWETAYANSNSFRANCPNKSGMS
ncbi:hypothetical protein FKM82_022840 [Ascaphus truei]